MKARDAIATAALSVALIYAAGRAGAQTAGELPTHERVQVPGALPSSEASVGPTGGEPTGVAPRIALPTSAFGPVVGPSTAQGEPEHYARTPDPTGGQYFAMPGARTLPQGDGALSVGSLLGWVALRYGLHRRVDVGVGVPYALVGVSAEMRIALVLERNWALSAWAMAQVPLHPGTSAAGDFFGFTWGGGGAWGAVGPLVSIFGDRGGVHFGVHLAQRVSMGGLWGLAHVSVDARVTDGVKILGQVLTFGELVNEASDTVARRVLLGPQQPRVMPYGTLGVRLFNRRSSVDVGALLIVGDKSLLAYGPVSLWPWLSAVHAF